MTIDDRVAVLALVDGQSLTTAATVVHRDQTMLHVSTDDPLPLPVGDVVGLMALSASPTASGGDTGAVALALVTESVGATVTVLRVLDRRA